MHRLVRALLAGAIASSTTATMNRDANAAFTFTFRETTTGVAATGTGSIDLTGLSRIGEDLLPTTGISAQAAIAGVAGTVAVYTGIAGPGGFGIGSPTVASEGGGDSVAVNGSSGFIGVPRAYVSGSHLSSTMEFAGATFVTLGLAPGIYTWNWGNGSNADSLTVEIGAVATPEPASATVFGAGVPGLVWFRRRRAPGILRRLFSNSGKAKIKERPCDLHRATDLSKVRHRWRRRHGRTPELRHGLPPAEGVQGPPPTPACKSVPQSASVLHVQTYVPGVTPRDANVAFRKPGGEIRASPQVRAS